MNSNGRPEHGGITVVPRMWYNANLDSKLNFVPGLMGMLLIIGKVIPFMTLGLVQMTVSSLAAGLVFGIWMKGSLFLLYAMAMVFCFSTLGVGVLMSTIARTQQQAMFMAWFFLTFSTLLSGFFVPIENIPAGVVQYLPYFNPLRCFIVIIREIFQKGTEFRFIWKEAAMMGAIGLARSSSRQSGSKSGSSEAGMTRRAVALITVVNDCHSDKIKRTRKDWSGESFRRGS